MADPVMGAQAAQAAFALSGPMVTLALSVGSAVVSAGGTAAIMAFKFGRAFVSREDCKELHGLSLPANLADAQLEKMDLKIGSQGEAMGKMEKRLEHIEAKLDKLIERGSSGERSRTTDSQSGGRAW